MNRLLHLLVAAICMLAVLWSCQEGEDIAVFSLSETELTMDSVEGDTSITVTSEGEWSAISSAEWCTVAQQDNTLKLHVEKNYIAEPRTATVTVTSGGDELSVAVTQSAGSGKFEAFTVSSSQYPALSSTEGDALSLPYTEGVIPFMVTVQDKHCVWSLEVMEGTAFITVPSMQHITSNKRLNIRISENNTFKMREGKLKIWSEYQGLECVYILTIKQTASTPLTVSHQEVNVAAETGSVEVAVTGGKEEWTVASSADWCTLEKKGTTLTINVAKNEQYEPRTATVTVSSGEESVEIKVTQSATTAEPLAVSQQEVNVAAEGGSVEVTVTGGKEPWKATTSAEWCVAEKKEGTLTVKVSKNEAYEPRTATVTVSSGEESIDIKVAQASGEAAPLTVSKTEVSIDASGGKSSITVTGGKEAWTAASSADWCTTSKTNNTLSIEVEANYTTEPRTAVVTISSGEEKVEVNVTQVAGDGLLHAFTVSSTQYEELPERDGGEISLTEDAAEIAIRVTRKDANCKWTATVLEGADFVSIPELVDVSGSKRFDIAVKENIIQAPREAKVQIRSEYQGMECVYILTIKQDAFPEKYVAFTVASTAQNVASTAGAAITMPYREKEFPLTITPTKERYKWSAEVVEGAEFVSIPEVVDCSEKQTIPITIANNSTAAKRVAKVKISSKYYDYEDTYELTINQEHSQYTNLQLYAKDDELKVMSFNVWVNIDAADPLGWPNRKEACFEMIRHHRPALIGLQETRYGVSWIDLHNALKKNGYDGFAIVRWDGSQSGNGEGTGILYDTNVLEIYAPDSNSSTPSSGNFWLSNPSTVPVTGEVGRDWLGAQYRRVANWALFKHKKTGKTICYINTHLDLRQPARVKEMELIMQKFEELGAGCDYWISTADYNATEGSAEMQIAIGEDGKMKSARAAAPAGKTDNDRTYNGTAPNGGGIIDHVLCTKSMEVVEYHTIDDAYGFVPYLSDHFPVYAIIKL